MSFITSALGAQPNGYNVQNASGSGSPQYIAQGQTDYGQIYGEQGTLAQQLLAQSQGQGPNIANLQLQQATNQNIKQGAGQIASQRGMNPALAQRIIAQNTASTNQNAAGQSGILRAQQQLAAQSGLANVYGQQAGEAATNLQTNVGSQQSTNMANAQIAQNNVNLQAAQWGGGLGGAASILAKGGRVSDAPVVSHIHLQKMLSPSGDKAHPLHFLSGGGFGSAGDLAIFAPLATKGAGPGAAGGSGSANPKMFQNDANPTSGMSSVTGTAGGNMSDVGGLGAQSASNWAGLDTGAGAASDMGLSAAADEGAAGIASDAAMAAAHGGKVPAMVSPGERYIPPHLVKAVRHGKLLASQASKKIPGKANVAGDSEKNDIVPAALAPGGVVIPRTKADNDRDAREFLMAIEADKKKKLSPTGYTKVLEARRKNA